MTLASMNTNKTWSETVQDLDDEFRKWGDTQWLRPSWNQAQRDGGAVTIYYETPGMTMPATVTCAAFNPDRAKNLRAIYFAIRSARLMEQRGMGGVLKQVAEHLALSPGRRAPLDVLGVSADATPELLRSAYRIKLKQTHPDHGGSREALDEVRQAGEDLGI